MSKTKTTQKTAGAKAAKTAKASKAKPAKHAKKRKAPATNGAVKKVSAIDAAAKVLAGSKQAMSCKELIEAMSSQGLWTSPGGKTPHATLYSAILREINAKAKAARFKKTDRGQFASAKVEA